jgi:hypothetical protein
VKYHRITLASKHDKSKAVFQKGVNAAHLKSTDSRPEFIPENPRRADRRAGRNIRDFSIYLADCYKCIYTSRGNEDHHSQGAERNSQKQKTKRSAEKRS